MTVEEQVRRMLAEAVAAEPAPEGAPLERVARRRRRRVVGAGAVATALVLAAAVVVRVQVTDTGSQALPTASRPSTPSAPPGWKTFRNSTYNLSFSYPPDWAVQGDGGFAIVPRELGGTERGGAPAAGPFAVTVALGLNYYRFVVQNGTQVTHGALPSGRAFIRYTVPPDAQGTLVTSYNIDWGRFCIASYCGSHAAVAAIQATDQALLDRYGPTAERILATFAPLRPTQPSTGDPTRPACRPDQWRPMLSAQSKLAFDRPRWVIGSAIRYLRGPACHLRTTLRLTVERPDGTPVAVPGTPAAVTVEADLPEDGQDTSEAFLQTATMRFWGWDNWCKEPMPRARVRVTADQGASATRPLPPRSVEDPRRPCRADAPWRILPLQ